MKKSDMSILGFAGSLRRNSYNRGLLRAAGELMPSEVEFRTFDLEPIPLYNEDVREQGDPEPVRQFKEAIKAADALLIATPEYNYSIPGVLKNAIDWASRPPSERVLYHKPVAIMGSSTSLFGTVRAQLALRHVFIINESFVMPKPEVLVFKANERFDSHGNLTDDDTREHVQGLVEGLIEWTKRVQD